MMELFFTLKSIELLIGAIMAGFFILLGVVAYIILYRRGDLKDDFYSDKALMKYKGKRRKERT